MISSVCLKNSFCVSSRLIFWRLLSSNLQLTFKFVQYLSAVFLYSFFSILAANGLVVCSNQTWHSSSKNGTCVHFESLLVLIALYFCQDVWSHAPNAQMFIVDNSDWSSSSFEWKRWWNKKRALGLGLFVWFLRFWKRILS